MIHPSIVGMTRAEQYLSAITDADGTINVGYVVILRMLNILRVVLVFLALLTITAIMIDPKQAIEAIKVFGIAVAVVSGGLFGTALAACGVFLWGDSRVSANRRIVTRMQQVSTPVDAIDTTGMEPEVEHGNAATRAAARAQP